MGAYPRLHCPSLFPRPRSHPETSSGALCKPHLGAIPTPSSYPTVLNPASQGRNRYLSHLYDRGRHINLSLSPPRQQAPTPLLTQNHPLPNPNHHHAPRRPLHPRRPLRPGYRPARSNRHHRDPHRSHHHVRGPNGTRQPANPPQRAPHAHWRWPVGGTRPSSTSTPPTLRRRRWC